MSIKKILLFSFIIIFVPFAIVNIFIKKDEITFVYTSNSLVRVYREETGNIDKVPLEEYIYGVVSSEMPVSFEYEALKAQAVASRTYVMYQMQKNVNNKYDVYDSINSQVYMSDTELKDKWKDKYIEYSNKIKKVVLDTIGQYLTYEGNVIEAFFFSTSVGYTENSEDVFSEQLPYLRSVESKWDESSPIYNDEKEMSKNEFFNKLSISYSDNLEITDVEKTNTGRIKKLRINGQEFTGKEVRTKLELRSTFFEIINNDNNVVIKTRGYGHGVGMSQYGANGMALAGFTYDQILKYYYTDVEIQKIKN